MENIGTYIKYMEDSTERNFMPSDFSWRVPTPTILDAIQVLPHHTKGYEMIGTPTNF